ncbi:hypothetical protein E1301_Tti019122 [Triplophysa tibetana]|uniref:Immunoglobulin domain-containing protein n=1 Tax=Triplophysa tibetana TaxID=1572043 RepID=A0A5A9NU53_9TELE|nr:hypothetical protein E1301_Tti019122 [Triplophysa tibetana]
MKNLLMLFCSLILNGVFGADDVKVSVMEGDSVTLTINPDDIKSASNLEWTFKDTIIAKIDIESKDSPVKYPNERFRDRLMVDRQTGSLTIKNITSEDSGEYKLQIRGKREIKKTFRVSVSEMSTVSLMEGDFFTLQAGVKIQTDDVIQWKFNGDVLNLSRVANCDVNHQTGDLNIANIRRDQSGEYEVNVNGGSLMLHKTFRINVTELEPLSVNEGDSIILHTNTETQTDDVIRWKFEATLIAQFKRMSNDVSYDNAGGKFRGRLILDHQTGSLTITDFRSDDSGIYDVNVNNSKHIIHRRFNVTVKGECLVFVYQTIQMTSLIAHKRLFDVCKYVCKTSFAHLQYIPEMSAVRCHIVVKKISV